MEDELVEGKPKRYDKGLPGKDNSAVDRERQRMTVVKRTHFNFFADAAKA